MGTIFAFIFAMFCFAVLLVAAGVNALGSLSFGDGCAIIAFVCFWMVVIGSFK